MNPRIEEILKEIRQNQLDRQLAKGLYPNINTKIWDESIKKLEKELDDLTKNP